MNKSPRQNLIRILQNAHAGELAAAYAYRGHWKSLKASREKEKIKQIESEEWEHRENVRNWLEKLDAKPRKLREAAFWAIGRILGFFCFVSGWFLPMYFAGKLESQNVEEYKTAAHLAKELEMPDCFAEMLEMSLTERQHEIFFSQVVANHRLLAATKKVFGWS